MKLSFFTSFQDLWRKSPQFYCFHYLTVFLVTCPDLLIEVTTAPKSTILLQECKGAQTGGCVSPNNTRSFKHCSGVTKLNLDMLSNAISYKLLQSHPCLQQPVGLYLEIRDGHYQWPGQVLLGAVLKVTPKPTSARAGWWTAALSRADGPILLTGSDQHWAAGSKAAPSSHCSGEEKKRKRPLLEKDLSGNIAEPCLTSISSLVSQRQHM